MQPVPAGSQWEILQASAHLPEVQAMLHREIIRGAIRVVPASGGGIRIILIRRGSPLEDFEPFGRVVTRLNDGHPSVPLALSTYQ